MSISLSVCTCVVAIQKSHNVSVNIQRMIMNNLKNSSMLFYGGEASKIDVKSQVTISFYSWIKLNKVDKCFIYTPMVVILKFIYKEKTA